MAPWLSKFFGLQAHGLAVIWRRYIYAYKMMMFCAYSYIDDCDRLEEIFVHKLEMNTLSVNWIR